MNMINKFLICPKCSRMHDDQVFVCLSCKFSHETIEAPEVSVGADAGGSELEIAVTKARRGKAKQDG